MLTALEKAKIIEEALSSLGYSEDKLEIKRAKFKDKFGKLNEMLETLSSDEESIGLEAMHAIYDYVKYLEGSIYDLTAVLYDAGVGDMLDKAEVIKNLSKKGE